MSETDAAFAAVAKAVESQTPFTTYPRLREMLSAPNGPLALGEMLRPCQIEQERCPGIGDEPDAPAVAVDERQGHRVDRRLLRPRPAPMHRYRPPHSFTT